MPEDLGPWQGDDLGATAAANADVGSDHELPVDVRFKAGVVRLVRKRLVQEGAGSDPTLPAVFLLMPSPPTEQADRAARVPMLDNGMTSVAGRVWFVVPNLAAGYCIDAPGGDDEVLFLAVCNDLSAGDVPAVVFDPRPTESEVRYYPRGLNVPGDYEALRLDATDVTLDAVNEVVDTVHARFLATPRLQRPPWRLWRRASSRWASANAEKAVQQHLVVALQGRFPAAVVRDEQWLASGRYDVEIDERDPADEGVVIRRVLLELKVLRAYGATGTAVSDRERARQVRDGITQAGVYAREQGALAAALYCFDMRPIGAGDCFARLRSLAIRLRVSLQSWHIFASAAEYRDYVVGGGSIRGS